VEAAPSPDAPQQEDTKCNDDYLAEVIEALNVIYGKYPDIHQRDALPLASDDLPAGTMTGYGAPFDPDTYTAQYKQSLETGDMLGQLCTSNMSL
jgi:hypothetical protein